MAKKNKKFKHTCGLPKKRKQVLGPQREFFQQNILQQALAHHQANRLPLAETLYRQILSAEPRHPDALHFLGMLAHQVGKSEIAAELISKALNCRPDYVDAYNNLGIILNYQGKLEEAVASYTRALNLKPDYAQVYNNLGITLKDQGKLEEAIASFRRAFNLKPDYAEAHNNLGITLKDQGKLEEAVVSYRRALNLKPDYAQAHNNLGIALKDQGKLEEAVASFRGALSLKPDYVEAHNNLGITLKDQGNLEEALSSFRQALNLKPDYAEAHNNLGIILKDQGKLEEAIASYRRALNLKPDFAEAHNNLGIILTDQGKLKEAVACYRQALTCRPEYSEAHSYLLYCLNYIPGQSRPHYLKEARHYGRKATAKVTARFTDWTCNPKPERLRVGMISGDLRNHPVGYFLENILANIDSSQIDLIAYQTHQKEDELTARIRSCFVNWKPLVGLHDEAAARLIHEDGVHILLDLSGHTGHNRLPVFAWKPAPVQATWLGYFASTGIAEMDYVLADPVSFPESLQEYFTERVWYLPETRFCFSPPVIGEELTPTPLPALRNGYITFGCFQKFAKINDEVLAAWGRIFRIMPQARLRLQNSQLYSPALREQLRRRLVRSGIAPERVTLKNPVPRIKYFKAHAHIDIILDTFPFTGGTTTCEALWMGVPTVTLVGKTMLARQGASMLACAGLADWIAGDDEDYVAKAVAHAADLAKLVQLRVGLRQQVLTSPLFDGPRFARNFEAAMWGMWRCFRAEQ